jgi:hypothetical protein
MRKEAGGWQELLQFALLGPLLGIALGSLMLVILLLSSNRLDEVNTTLQLSCTLLLPYAVFYVSENELETSGILACVTAAIVVARGAWTLFIDKEGIEHFWHTVEFIANTLIFMLVGVIVAEIFVQRQKVIKSEDWMCLIILYCASMGLRYLMLLIFYPILANIGFGTVWQDCMVIGWGGMRGAVGLALALVVDRDSKIDEKTGTRILFHTAGVAALSLIINGTTCKFLVQALGLTERHWSQSAIFSHLHATLRARLKSQYEKLAATPKFDIHSPSEMHHMIEGLVVDVAGRGAVRAQSIYQDPALTEGQTRLQESLRARSLVTSSRSLSMVTRKVPNLGGDPGALQSERELFLSMMRAEYWDMVEHGLLQPRCRATPMLLRSVHVAESNSHMPLCTYADLITAISSGKNGYLSTLWLWFKEGQFLGHRFVPCRRGRVTFDVYTIICAIDAHRAAQERHVQFHSTCTDEKLLQACTLVQEESRQEVQALQKFLADNSIGQSLVSRVRTKQLAFHLLVDQEHTVKEWLHRGTVNQRDADELMEDMRTSFERVIRHTGLEHPEAGDMEVDLIAQISDSQHGGRAAVGGRRSKLVSNEPKIRSLPSGDEIMSNSGQSNEATEVVEPAERSTDMEDPAVHDPQTSPEEEIPFHKVNGDFLNEIPFQAVHHPSKEEPSRLS